MNSAAADALHLTNSFDVEVTWKRPDGTNITLPANLCFNDDFSDLQRRIEVLVGAIGANLADFPGAIPVGSLPVKIVFKGVPE